ncbi:hypothetical protein CBS147347_9635 [Aspergillus niger]|nr:hypothetical protein CBS147347_9635 [Aspergillus niger]
MRIRAALSHAEAIKDTKVAGIGTTKTGYVIRFKDEQSATTARNNPEWLGELGNETKLVKPRFGVVAHRVPTEDFDLDQNKGDSIEKIMQENDLAGKGYQIKDIAWLKRKEIHLGRCATMGIWLSTPQKPLILSSTMGFWWDRDTSGAWNPIGLNERGAAAASDLAILPGHHVRSGSAADTARVPMTNATVFPG